MLPFPTDEDLDEIENEELTDEEIDALIHEDEDVF